MKKIITILFFSIIALFTWNFVSFEKSPSSQPALSVSNNQIVAYAADQRFMTSMLQGTNVNSNGRATNLWFFNLYNIARGLLNISLFAFLVYVAFRNILNLNVETYSIKKIMPRLIFAAFLGNLILPIAVIFSSLVDALQSSVPFFHPAGSFDWIGMVKGGLAITNSVGSILAVLTMFINFAVGSLLIIAPIAFNLIMVIALLVLALFHSLRPWIVLLVVAAGPIAIGLYILPETEATFKRWYKIFIFWMLYPLLLAVVYYLASLIPSMAGAVGDGFLSSLIGNIIPLILKIALFAVAVRAPFTWEKDVAGAIAALPGQVQNAYKQGSGLAVAAGKATTGFAYDIQTNMRDRRLTDVLNKGRSSGAFTSAAQADLDSGGHDAEIAEGTEKATLPILQSRMDDYTALNMFRKHAADVTDEEFQGLYQKYRDNTLRPDQIEDHRYAQEFFNQNDTSARAEAEQGVRASFLPGLVKQQEDIASKEVIASLDKNALYRWADLEQKKGFGSLGLGYAAQVILARQMTQETSEKERIKALKRKSDPFQGNTSRMTRGKSEQERHLSDMNQSNISQNLRSAYGWNENRLIEARRDQILDEAQKSGRVISRDDATKEAMMRVHTEAQNLDVTGANIVGWDNAFWDLKPYLKNRKGESASHRDFEDIMNQSSIYFHKMKELTSREARAPKTPEEQLQIANAALMNSVAGSLKWENGVPHWDSPDDRGRRRQQTRGGQAPAGNRGGAGASGATGGSSELAGLEESLDDLSAGINLVGRDLKTVNSSVLLVRNQIRTTVGTPLQRMTSLAKNVNPSEISSDDIDELGAQTELGLAGISETLLRKSPGNEAEINQFVQDLDASKGLSTPEMIDRAKAEFYPNEQIDPDLENAIAHLGSNQVVSMAARMAKDENKALTMQAGQLSINPNISEKVVRELDQSIQIFNQHDANPRSVSPEAIQGVKSYIASHIAGLSDSSIIDKTTIDIIARQLSAITVKDPNES